MDEFTFKVSGSSPEPVVKQYCVANITYKEFYNLGILSTWLAVQAPIILNVLSELFHVTYLLAIVTHPLIAIGII